LLKGKVEDVVKMHWKKRLLIQSYSGLVSEEEEVSSAESPATELKVYRLPPEEVEKFLLAQYGDKLEAVNANKPVKQNRKHARYTGFN
jgi:hypothetical protein